MPDINQQKARTVQLHACIAESKRLMDAVIRDNPLRLRYDIDAKDERAALAVLAGNIASDNFKECMKTPKAR